MNNNNTDGSNTALEAPKIRGILIVLHNCHETGLHFFQLPESRIMAAHALQRGIAIFSPTASAASSLTSAKKQPNRLNRPLLNAGDTDREKYCWSASLDGDELLGPLLYEWVREMDLVNLPRMAIGIANGANLIFDSSLYTTLRLQSMVLYGSHHPMGFDEGDLDRDIVPATTFVVYPRNKKATEFALQQFKRLQVHEADNNDDEAGKLRRDEENSELEKQQSGTRPKPRTFFQKSQVYAVDPHSWTTSMCQSRLPEYHTRCRSFFRHVAKFQQKKQRKRMMMMANATSNSKNSNTSTSSFLRSNVAPG